VTTEASRNAECGSGIRGTGGASPNSTGKVDLYVSFAQHRHRGGRGFRSAEPLV
jgi:hypothetical protein